MRNYMSIEVVEITSDQLNQILIAQESHYLKHYSC